MSSPTKLLNRAGILPAIVLLLSVLSLFLRPVNFSTPCVYVSVTGLVAAVLYALGIYKGNILFYMWAVVQLFVVKQGGGHYFFDVSQAFKLPVFIPLALGQGYYLGINLVAVCIIALIAFLWPEELVGQTLFFAAYRGKNDLGIEFPLKGRVERRVTLSGEKDWLLVVLDKQINYKGGYTSIVLISRNDKLAIVKHQLNQLVFFKPVPDLSAIKEGENDKNDFKDEVWALCR